MAEKKTAQNKKHKIGIMFSNKDNPFYGSLYNGAKSYADDTKADVELLFKQVYFSAESQCKALKELANEDLSGLILVPFDHPEVLEHLLPFYDQRVPIVTLNTDLPRSSRLAYVGSDSYKCGRASGELLSMITGGRAEIAIITGSRDFTSHEQRISGFKDYLKEHCPKMTIEDIIECKNDDYTAYDLTNRLLLAYPTLSAMYFTAGGVVGACKALDQMTVPRKLSVVSFDVTERTREYLKKKIITASLVQDPFSQGYKAMEVICEKIFNDKNPKSQEIIFPVSVMLSEMV